MLRNAALLGGARLIGIPLTILITAVVGRYLGPTDFGFIYLATTVAGLGFLFVDFGHGGTLPAAVAQDTSSATELLGSSLTWRIAMSVFVSAVVLLGSYLLDYEPLYLETLALACLCRAVISLTSAMHETIRGFERADVAALAMVTQGLFTAALVIPTVLLGGGLVAAVGAQTVACTLVFALVAWQLARMRLGRLRASMTTVRQLSSKGVPFFFMGLIVALQPNIDALMVSQLAAPEALGWLAAAQRLVGVLVFPATAISGALYPTLCRLHLEDPQAFRDSASSTLRLVTIFVVPGSIGCFFFADIGVAIFGEQAFEPVIANLQVLAPYLFLVFFTIVLGTVITASGHPRQWAITQLVCVGISVLADPFLVPWFEQRYGNGGLGVCVSLVLSEIFMVALGIRLVPSGVLDRRLGRAVAGAVGAGGVMALVAWAVRGWAGSYVAAPVSVATYVGSLLLIGGEARDQLRAGWGMAQRKLRRRLRPR